MATRKINEDALIKKVFKKVNKDLGVDAKTPPSQMKSFNEKLKAAPTPFLYRVKDVWKAFAALDGRILYYWLYNSETHNTFRNCDDDSICIP